MPLLVGVTATRKPFDGAPRIRLNAAYAAALEQAGAIPVVLPPLSPSSATAALARLDGLVLTGGEDVDPARFGEPRHPALGEVVAVRDAWELALAAVARTRRIPVLAICRGIQLLAVAAGGTLVQDLPSQQPSDVAHDPGGARDTRVHEVRVEPGSRLASALGTQQLRVNSFHHQAVRDAGAGFRASAWAADGVVEGMESTDPSWWALGVQWHPEELAGTAEPWDRRLFEAFAGEVERRG